MNPWDNEPDFFEFIEPKTGFSCFILRHYRLKHLCGYVAVPIESFPAINIFTDHEHYLKYDAYRTIDVHGGVTFCKTNIDQHAIPSIKVKDLSIVVGFDCAHAGDYSPGFDAMLNWSKRYPDAIEEYKNFCYVLKNTVELAIQLKDFLNKETITKKEEN